MTSWLAFNNARSARPVGWDDLEHAEPEVVEATAEQEFATVQTMVPLLVSPDQTVSASPGADSYTPGEPIDSSRSAALEKRRSDVLNSFRGGTVRLDDVDVSDLEVDMLLEEASKLFTYRFGTTDPTAYIMWREDTGYDFIGWEWLHRTWDFDPAWEVFLPHEPPMPESGDHRVPFAKLFNVVPDWGETGRNRPIKLAAEPKGVAVVLSEFQAGGYLQAELSGVWPGELWEGGRRGALCPWWVPPKSAEDIARANGVCRFAKVGALIELDDGSRSPYISTWIWDPQEGWWFLDKLSVVSHDGQTGAAVCY